VVALDSVLLEILVDPEDKEPLLYFADEQSLYNRDFIGATRCGTIFRCC